MFGFAQLLAWIALTAPPALVDLLLSPQVFQLVRPALSATALHLEILDPREVRYILIRPDDFHSDLNLLRRRFTDLQDAPALSDGRRFPDTETVNQLIAFNRSFRQHLCLRRPVEHSRLGEIQDAVREADELYHIWDTVRDTRCQYYYVTVRRQALKKLRDMLGAEAYYSGRLPPPVPLWRFHEMN
jgi:hypothetical protein